jgi:hypothetical protein
MGAALCGRGGPSMKARAVGLLMVPTTGRWSNNTHSLIGILCKVYKCQKPLRETKSNGMLQALNVFCVLRMTYCILNFFYRTQCTDLYMNTQIDILYPNEQLGEVQERVWP